MAQWKELLIQIKKIEKKYGSSLRNPVTDVEISKLQLDIQEKLGNIELPKSYVEFLKTVNGLDFNGLVIYGVDEHLLDDQEVEDLQGFVDTNEIWYENEWQKQYIFWGESDTAWYCLDLHKEIYLELDKPSGTQIQSFESFDSMLTEALQTTLL
ncbi:SMI1 / KNR4 family protein [Paenibacillus sp. FSL R5-0490]|uniref:YrhA family protein n=1 Tax=Bacillales TaxID=1385 RepID=UPI00096C750C|nr:YrhA family protein [Paenibacillus sp. FSL R5-0490]OMF56598.1 SMI1 / KNR4 family protein [Paenibacillus sp. FSL R5-0490]